MAVVDLKAAKAAALDQIEYCNNYHCAGDCGMPHNSAEFREYARHVLSVFDDLESKDRRKNKEQVSEVRRKAKNLL